jgi:Fe2+ or Zn2+ uptake regulation protein
MMAVTFCQHCHQPLMHMRAGVRLTPLKARIFDLIKASSEHGISARELEREIYRGPKQRRPDTIRVHIWQINDLLLDTDVVIRADEWRRWYIASRRRSSKPSFR